MNNCRFCNSRLSLSLIDLGLSPVSNGYLTSESDFEFEAKYPLKVMVCENCWLVQTTYDPDKRVIFNNDYAYFSSTSNSWLVHSKDFSLKIIKKLQLSSSSLVAEIASNDGYLLKNFLNYKIPCVGIEPTHSTASVAIESGVPTIQEFFSSEFVGNWPDHLKNPDLIMCNNVLAHVPDIRDFTIALKSLLNNEGTITIEVPYLIELINKIQFDTIYHEHYSYFSLTTLNNIFTETSLKIIEVEKLETHGGSLRLYIAHSDDIRDIDQSVFQILAEEASIGVTTRDFYSGFQEISMEICNNFLSLLRNYNSLGKKIVGFGAAAKGNTLLNFCEIDSDLIQVVFDSAPSKQGKFLPGSHIKILSPDFVKSINPDIVVVLPWNLEKEIIDACGPSVSDSTIFIALGSPIRLLNKKGGEVDSGF